MFFSAAIHQNLVNDTHKLNLKVSRIDSNKGPYILLEFIDVTNQYLRIAQLKENINKLHVLNEELKIKEKTIHALAYYDNLTNIANRNLFYEMAEDLCRLARRQGKMVGILFIDIDDFKTINDTYGHRIGDLVIVEVSKSLMNSARSCDLVVRYGGDEFLMFFSIERPEDIISVASRIVDRKIVVTIEEHSIPIALSVGISIEKNRDDSIDDLISEADKAMYLAKRQGGSGWHIN